jgi:uncharacterized protein (TIGR00297 family)
VSLNRSEVGRKLIHLGCGAFAFLLRDLSPPQAAAAATAAFLFNWQVLPRIGGRSLWREGDRTRGYPLGILLYPLAILGLILWFWRTPWMAAAMWGILAFGDGMATIVGEALGGPRLPWNPRKGWAGFLAFFLFGSLAAAVLTTWTERLPFHPLSWHLPATLGVACGLALVCALVESLPTRLDDNLTVPIVGALVLPLLAQADPMLLLLDPAFPGRLWLGLGLNGVIALAALAARSIDLGGAITAVLIGTAITASLGLPALGLMVAFFALGTGVTRLGYAKKAARGIAQERGGARGWQHALANGGVPAFLAVMASVSPGPMGALLVLAYAAAVATAAADTGASEIGKAFGRRTFLITTLRPVAPGTEGAVSLEGTLGGAAAGLAVALVGVLAGLLTLGAALVVALAGLLGSLAESLIGTVAERRGWLDNNQLNALNTAIGALLLLALVSLGSWVRHPGIG